MRFEEFQEFRQRQLGSDPSLLDAAETNVYRALAALRPEPPAHGMSNDAGTVYRCDLARTWLRRYGLPEELSRQAMVCRGVRHGLEVVFQWLHTVQARLWLPSDVYPVYFELARAAGLAPETYPTLPSPVFPTSPADDDRPEYLLLANPSKPLGRYLSGTECTAVIAWLQESPQRHVLIDSVYDLEAPFDAGTQSLLATGRAILLHSVTKGWLWPRTFGIALIGPEQTELSAAFRAAPPTQDQLRLADRLLTDHADVPQQVADALAIRAERLFEQLPDEVLEAIATASRTSRGNYFFPVAIPAETLQREHALLALPVTVFGQSTWSGSILTSLADAFGPTPALAR